MAKNKTVYYGIHGPQFKGVVHSVKEYNSKVVGQKGTYGKKFENEQDALMWVETFISPLKKQQSKDKNVTEVYAVWGPDFTGIVHSKEEYDEKVFRKKGMRGKKCTNEQQAQKWIATLSESSKNKKKQHTTAQPGIQDKALSIESSLIEEHGQTIMYIDGGYKNTIGTYGIVAYSSKNIEPIYKDFGYVYDQRFNDLKNTGAELMACLRALEWAFANKLQKVCIIYDYEGVVNHIDKPPLNEGIRLYQEMVTGFKKHMTIYFLHVRHSNKTLHKEAHHLTQLTPI